jgi:hypothetical protein
VLVMPEVIIYDIVDMVSGQWLWYVDEIWVMYKLVSVQGVT